MRQRTAHCVLPAERQSAMPELISLDESRSLGAKRRLRDPADRFLSKVRVHEWGCWEWQGYCFKQCGYGKFTVGKTGTTYAHVWAYRLFVGPVPAGLELDHLCRNRRCVNPEHLEPVTHQVN